jgi:type II secretory ATPase GspE/PulE/Tfp pilus assembly ATPase PilB-like protein
MQRVPEETVKVFLEQTPLLRGMHPGLPGKLAPHVEQKGFVAGQAIVPPGIATSGIGFLLSGRATLRLVNSAAGSDSLLEELLPGDAFGEIGLLLGRASPLSVMAEEDCHTLHLRADIVENVLSAVPGVAHALAKRLASRLVQVAVMGARSAPAPRPTAAQPVVPAPGAPAAAPGPTLGKGEIRFVEIAAFSVTGKLLDLIPPRLIWQHRMLPLELRGKTLVVGMVSPNSTEARQELRRVLHNVDPEIVAVGADDFNQTLVRLKLDVGDRGGGGAGPRQAPRPSYLAENRRELEKAQLIIGEEVVNLLDRILLEAMERGASDVHIEPEVSTVRVRFRVQGMLHERREAIPASFAAPLVARIKVLADLDITERRLPQDGRIVAQIARREYNFRVSTLTASRGEKVVIRILDPTDVMRPLGQIFLDGQVSDMVERAIAAPHGAIVVAGPTGSGKSSTLYSLLNQRRTARPDNNVVTVEDPVEYSLPGITQVPVVPKVGLDFPVVLRALMRQDPDVVMIGELRDSVSATIAVEASLTGHLVLTSIHGSSVVAVLQRLQHLGCDPTLLGQALNLIIVQRLVPRLCPSCVTEEEVAPALLENLRERQLVGAEGGARLPRAPGCEACERTGRKGRVAVIEALAWTDDLRGALSAKIDPAELLQRAARRNQLVSLNHSARLLMARKLLAPADALLAVAV